MLACRCRIALCAIVAALFLVVGCQRSSDRASPADVSNGQTSDPVATVPQIEKTDDDAATAFRKLIEDVATGEADDVVAALPPSYREDLDRVLALGLGPLDPQARRALSEAIADLAQTLIAKESFVLASNRVELAGSAAPFVREHFAALCRVVAAVAQWPGWSSVDHPQGSSLIAATVRAVAVEPTLVDALRKVRFRNTENSGGKQRVLVHTGDESSGVVFAVERIEGFWLPDVMAEHWSAAFDDLQTEPLSTGIAQRESLLRELTSRIRDINQSLAAVKTQEEFDALADRASTLLLATAAQAETAPRPVKPDEFATVIILGALSEEQKDRLVWDLAAHSDDPSSGIADAVHQGDEGRFTISVGPVSDLDAFVKRLSGLRIEKIDAQARTVTARLAAP